MPKRSDLTTELDRLYLEINHQTDIAIENWNAALAVIDWDHPEKSFYDAAKNAEREILILEHKVRLVLSEIEAIAYSASFFIKKDEKEGHE